MIELRLTRANRLWLARAFRHNKRVDIGIDCAIEGQMSQAFIDDASNPVAFKIEQGPFCYFAGAADGPSAREMIENLSPLSLMMPSPAPWHALARAVHGDKLCVMPRYSYVSAELSVDHLQSILHDSGLGADIVPLEGGLATEVCDWHPFVDLSMFDSGQDFAERGLGFCMLAEGDIIAAAYSSLVCSKGIEVSVYVVDAYRKRGMATALASKLLLACLVRGIAAHWDAANETSVHIAARLGYGQAEAYEAYWVGQ